MTDPNLAPNKNNEILGEITEINSLPIQEVEMLDESLNNTENENKWRLIEEIKTKGAEGRNLRGADLIDADLSRASLSGANLTRANLSNGDLSGANLNRADLSGANVTNTIFGNNEGISESMKLELIKRGAIFEDSPGDRSRVLV